MLKFVPTPEKIDEFKARATLDEAGMQARQNLKDLQDAYQQSLSIFQQAPQFQAPQRQSVSPQDQLILAAGDALRDIVSTAPRKFRQERNPSVQTAQGLKEQEYAKSLQEAQIAFQNQQQQILAQQKAAEVGLQGKQVGYEGALTAEERAARNLQNATQASQFAQGMAFDRQKFASDDAYRNKVFDENKNEFEANLAWDKEKFNTTEWDFAQKDFDKMVKSGLDVETAKRRAFGKYILQDQQIAKSDIDLKTAQALFKKVLPEQIKDQLAEYEFNKKMRPLQLRNAARVGQGQAKDPLDPYRARLNQLQGLIDAANANQAAAAFKGTTQGAQNTDANAFRDLIDYYVGEQKKIAQDMNFVAGKTVVDPSIFVPSQRSLRETVGG